MVLDGEVVYLNYKYSKKYYGYGHKTITDPLARYIIDHPEAYMLGDEKYDRYCNLDQVEYEALKEILVKMLEEENKGKPEGKKIKRYDSGNFSMEATSSDKKLGHMFTSKAHYDIYSFPHYEVYWQPLTALRTVYSKKMPEWSSFYGVRGIRQTEGRSPSRNIPVKRKVVMDLVIKTEDEIRQAPMWDFLRSHASDRWGPL